MKALAEAIRQLEVNTAALQLPSSDLQADSCQSLQCSSGYGTMTNVSAGGSVEAVCTSAGGQYYVVLCAALMQSRQAAALDQFSGPWTVQLPARTPCLHRWKHRPPPLPAF